jgi:hypothetical protein
MKSLAVFTITATLFSVASAFTTPLTNTQNTIISKTSITAAPENFSDVAETIAEAASSLKGKTIVVKYGGVRCVTLRSFEFVHLKLFLKKDKSGTFFFLIILLMHLPVFAIHSTSNDV